MPWQKRSADLIARRTTRSTQLLWLHLTLAAWLAWPFQPAAAAADSPWAGIRLYNPGTASRTSLVEIPVGQIANPDLVAWEAIQLSFQGQTVPHAIREGRAHQRAQLRSGIARPLPEDVLVFSVEAPPGWSRVDVGHVPQPTPPPRPPLVRQEGAIVIAFSGFEAAIDERSGALLRLVADGEPLLKQPMTLVFFKVGDGVVGNIGPMGPGIQEPQLTVTKTNPVPHTAQLAAWSNAEALSELHFVLTPAVGPPVALSYRIYPCRQLEILCDERPWSGSSAWLRCGLEVRLAPAGAGEKIFGTQTHYPFYGFKDYPAAVKAVGMAYQAANTTLFEFGEESVNGRFWHRRLAAFSGKDWPRRQELIEHLEEGLVAEVDPLRSGPLPLTSAVTGPRSETVLAEIMTQELRGERPGAAIVPSDASPAIVLKLEKKPGSEGDGYRIAPLSPGPGLEVAASSRLGLFQGARRIAAELKQTGSAPLVASSPVVDLRAGGFGGGGHEVDFPYGSELEWQAVFDRLIDSGMNVMTCLGMWGNWKMPVKFKYMPALWSNAPDAYDEVSGAKLREFDLQREKSLRLMRYLQERGVQVWLWIPVGAIPTTFETQFPEATVPPRGKTPRFMHPRYRQYLAAYFRELLELYPIDGFVLIRDDNGGIDPTPEYKEYVARSRTRHPVWEQYLIVYEMLRSLAFHGRIAVYPYFDVYEPRLETELPADLLIVGHGSGLGLLTRSFDQVAPMGDTWLDNLYASFRVPATAQMKRLLGDRNSFWIGGAYLGTELPWEALGFFGKTPTASVNTFRYEFGRSTFGPKRALDFLRFADAYEDLFAIMNAALLPHHWFRLQPAERSEVGRRARLGLAKLTNALAQLQPVATAAAGDKWLNQVKLYPAYFNYHLRRVESMTRMHELILSAREGGRRDGLLPESIRQQLISWQREVITLAQAFEQQAALVPGSMMQQTREAKFTAPFQESFVAGYDWSAGQQPEVAIPPFRAQVKTEPGRMAAGEPFELAIELHHLGLIPWMAGIGGRLALEGEPERLGLPSVWNFSGEPMVNGDRCLIRLRGRAPAEAGRARITVRLLPPSGDFPAGSDVAELTWD
ncbi:MAG: hypothetical protein U1G07_11010 [Verrucomicrobiota bacterium]